jgi:hypothetical protein
VTEDYAHLQHAVESAGFFTTFMPIEEVGDRMVCASHKYPEGHERRGLYGNSFWIAKRGADWFVAGWAPSIYRVPDTGRLAELCLRLLRRERGGAYGDFDEQVRRDFTLVPVSDEEFDRADGG